MFKKRVSFLKYNMIVSYTYYIFFHVVTHGFKYLYLNIPNFYSKSCILNFL